MISITLFLHFHNILYDFYCLTFLFISCVWCFSEFFFLRLMLFSCIFPYFPFHFLSIPSSFLHFIFLHSPYIFPCFSSHFLCLPSHFLHFHGIFSLCPCIFPSFFLRLMLFSGIFPYFSSRFLAIPSHFLHFQNIFYDFYGIHHPAIFGRQNNSPRYFPAFSLHFPILFLSFPLPTYHHISCIFIIFSRYPITFPAFSRHFLAMFLHFPKSCIFPYFSSFFLSFPLHTIIFISCIFTNFLRFLWHHPATFSRQNSGPRGNWYPTVSQLPSGT